MDRLGTGSYAVNANSGVEKTQSHVLLLLLPSTPRICVTHFDKYVLRMMVKQGYDLVVLVWFQRYQTPLTVESLHLFFEVLKLARIPLLVLFNEMQVTIKASRFV